MLPSIANSLATVVSDIFHDNQQRNELKEEFRKEIERIRHERAVANNRHSEQVKQMRQRVNLLYHQMEQWRSQELPMHRYASALKGSNTPSHIIVLQAQVCRAVHHMSVDSVQLQLMENLNQALHTLARDQQREQLKNLLWMVEARTELRQQQEDEIYHLCENVKEPSSGIDDLMNNLNLVKLMNPMSPNTSLDSWEEVTGDDFKKDKKSLEEECDSFDLFDDDEEMEFHKSLPTILEDGLDASEKKRRTTSLIKTGTWNSEKPQVAW